MMPKILRDDALLMPYAADIEARMTRFWDKKRALVGDGSLSDFANGYRYFGFHREADGWVYREWAPAAERMYVTGDFAGWDMTAYEMTRLDGGVFEIRLGDLLQTGQKVQAIVEHHGALLRRVPSYATRVVQDPTTYLWCAEVRETVNDYAWSDASFTMPTTPLIYECHIGMAQDKYGVGTYAEFTQHVLPRIRDAGYNTVQIMAVAEHPYYGSFGYQVSNFFAPSSRFGTAEELKALINTAHGMGIAVLLDIVHSHAVSNTVEGLGEFDGTPYQYFHAGARGRHPAWGTRLFDYDKHEVLHFLLSNVKYWMEEFHFDGFRFDGVTSMLYHDHGLGSAFTDYSMYFSMNTDVEAVTYLCLANALIREVNPHAITIAEDMSGMPGMCLPLADGGIGFDYRLSMGVPDLWVRYLREVPDEHWHLGTLWGELTSRRPRERVIGYCESHDQALVGDKTIMFRLCDRHMYTGMRVDSGDGVVDRGVALHKMIRLITASLAGDGYLNFMGNEFGHPEWIDFPREGNEWSYHYCRRQWRLVDDEALRYAPLARFDKAMLTLLQRGDLFGVTPQLLYIHEDDHIIAYAKRDTVFVFNFHPTRSFEGYFIPVPAGRWQVALATDGSAYNGFDRVDTTYTYRRCRMDGRMGIRLYIPSRTAIVLQKKTPPIK